MIFKSFENICLRKFDGFLIFASLFPLFVDLLPGLIMEILHLLYSEEN